MIKIYTATLCPYCQLAKRFLKSKGQDFEEVNLQKAGMDRDELERLTGGRTVPQIVIDGKSIGGYDELIARSQNGELPF